MNGDVLVIAEHWNGAPDGVTLQMLTKGRELADSAGVGLAVLVLGHGLDATVDALRDGGMDRIWVLDDPALAEAAGDLQAHAIAAAAKQIAPGLILVGYSLVGMELAPAIAVTLGVTAMTNCANAAIEDGAVVVTRPFFDGTQHAKIVLDDGDGPPLVAIQRGATPTVKLDAREVSVEAAAVDVAAIPARGRLVEVIEEAPSDVDITKAEIIVSVGRGIGGKEKIGVIEELAQALGGLMACSRPLVDLGWLPRERQVGASGKAVAPKIYLACGISGASQHLSGMSESRLIVAINKDANAPIFQVAHFGVVGDLFEIVPALTEQAGKDPV
jgi:electron transfer flavoprotein alpha subunit